MEVAYVPDSNQGHYKVEFIKDLLKVEFGNEIQSWSLEQKKHCDDACKSVGFLDDTYWTASLPTEGELTQMEATQIAADYIHSHYEANNNLDDQTVYELRLQYLRGPGSEVEPSCYWSFDYAPFEMSVTGYTVYITNEGVVWSSYVTPGIEEGSSILAIQTAFINEFGQYYGQWEQGNIIVFTDAAKTADPMYEKSVACFRKSTYPTISPDAISREKACKITAESLDIDEEFIKGAVSIGDDPNPVWKVYIFVTESDFPTARERIKYFVEIDSITREIKSIYQRPKNNSKWYKQLVLQRIIEDIDATWIEPESVG
ncbi:MAG: hypothetical protein GX096_02515 [Clostridiales bacterium]|nr:hypothetical protein [Clostridiales bacterium]